MRHRSVRSRERGAVRPCVQSMHRASGIRLRSFVTTSFSFNMDDSLQELVCACCLQSGRDSRSRSRSPELREQQPRGWRLDSSGLLSRAHVTIKGGEILPDALGGLLIAFVLVELNPAL